MPARLKTLIAFLLALSLSGGVQAQTPTAEACPVSQFLEWGGNGVVTPGDSNNVRDEPSTAGALIGKIAPGEPFVVLYDSATCAEGYLWVEVKTMSLRGWTVEMAADGGEPFIVPYETETIDVGTRAEDGSIRVEAAGVAFTVPAGLNIARVTMAPEVGFFGDVMSAQPSSLVFTFLDADDEPRGDIEIYPYAISDAVYDLYAYPDLEILLTEQPSLLEYAARKRMPQGPLAGSAALFGGAGAYLPVSGGNGLRFITYFAQTSVLFRQDTTFEYLYRGLTADKSFFVAAQNFPVKAPAGTVPASGSRDDAGYPRYLRQLETNLATQPSSAFTPDLALLDSVFTSLTITDAEALLRAIP